MDYFNRELSQLAFIERVLANACDTEIPLLERLKFLFICGMVLDEFFEIRVAGLKEKIALGADYHSSDGSSAAETLAQISVQAHNMVSKIYQCLNQQLLPELATHQITIVNRKKWTKTIKLFASELFDRDILPLLSPIAIDPAHPFPRLVNKSLNFAVTLSGDDAFSRNSNLAIVHAPRALKRIYKVVHKNKKADSFILLTDIITEHAQQLFPGMTVSGCYPFRLTRNSDLYLEDLTARDLAHTLSQELGTRRYGRCTRLEVSSDCPEDISNFLLDKHGLAEDDRYYCDGPVNLQRYLVLFELLDRPDLSFPTFNSSLPVRLRGKANILKAISEQDILLHHPFQSFNPVLDFIRQATLDSNVLAIKQTLYRTGAKSSLVKALVDAAKAGKEVTAVIELRARFDEESNIELANVLQEAGALVVYGVVGFKTHAKMTLVVRREGEKLKRYAHLGSGNYHEKTAEQYTDLGLFTYDQAITQDVQRVFQQLTGVGKALQLKQLILSPFNLLKKLLELINFEKRQAEKNKPAYIFIKINALSDKNIIDALYQASQAGVKIDLLVRGICCLRPQVEGLSENIRVFSVVDRFLEHSRLFHFYHAGEENFYCSSADCLERNLHHRVEVTFPISDPHLVKRLKQEVIQPYLQSSKQCWELKADGRYQLRRAKGDASSAQEKLIALLSTKQY